jgi:hypothetical protein
MKLTPLSASVSVRWLGTLLEPLGHAENMELGAVPLPNPASTGNIVLKLFYQLFLLLNCCFDHIANGNKAGKLFSIHHR